MIGEPAAELLRCSDAVIDNGGVDLEATNPIGVAREAKPHVLDPQYRRPLFVGDRVTQCLMPSRDVSVKIVQPQGQVQPPRASRSLKQEWDVIPLVSDLSRRAAVSSFVPIVEADNPGKLHEPGDQLQDISWAVAGADEEHHIKIAPAHEVRDIATGQRHGPDVTDDLRLVELVKEGGPLRMQRRLSGR